MNVKLLHRNHPRRGQALPAAIIIMAILLVLGLVFAGIIGRNIRQTSAQGDRNVAEQIALSGIRFAHSQLVNSEERADWRPAPTALSQAGDITRDPDVLYLRPGSGYGFRGAGDPVPDLGGPDGLGPYSRINYPGGYNLLRVRYAPSDPNVLASSVVNPTTPATGYLPEAGKARSYLIIESIGRQGRVNLTDPTTLPNTTGVKYRNYASEAEFRDALAVMQDRDSRIISSRKLIALASIGIIDHARFITNKDRTTRPAELGTDALIGTSIGGNPVLPPLVLGGDYSSPGGQTVSGGGSIFSNADLRFYGNVEVTLNGMLGDGIHVAGTTVGADDAASLLVRARYGDNSSNTLPRADADVLLDNAGTVDGTLDSTNPSFTTVAGLIRDYAKNPDQLGFPRSIGRKEPPSFLQRDGATGLNTYQTITSGSGRILGNGNTGRFGHGANIYVNNRSDLQMRSDESGREDVGAEESLVYDWLNPNNGNPNSGWQGSFYVPRGAIVKFNPTGLSITRDPRGPNNERFWRNPDGSNSNTSTIHYRFGDPDGNGPLPVYVINSLTNPADFNSPNPNWNNGFPFDGVLFFEGNVRVRGTLPADIQLTLISMGTIYIDGSIVKPRISLDGNLLTRPSRSSIILMAKDYVTVNTTQFFGIASGAGLSEKVESMGPDSNNPLVVPAANGSIALQAEFVFRNQNVPGLTAVTPENPTTWRPAAMDYVDSITNQPMSTNFILSHAMDEGAGSLSYVQMEINRGLAAPTYNFSNDAELPGGSYSNNAAVDVYGLGSFSPELGIGHRPYQKYPMYETRGYTLIRAFGMAGASNFAGDTITGTSNEGTWQLIVGGESNILNLFTTSIGGATTNDYVLRRAAITPHDIRIEAAIYAENGSFFVIPGRWFNNNPNDRRDLFNTWGATDAERNEYRLLTFGSTPETPFYGEPLDVKITVFGAVSENMPPPISAQTEWQRKWGFIPRQHGSSGRAIPTSHIPNGWAVSPDYVPNLTFIYDPVLSTGRTTGFVDAAGSYVRTKTIVPDPVGNPTFALEFPMPPMPRLPVSPTLAYFGEVSNP